MNRPDLAPEGTENFEAPFDWRYRSPSKAPALPVNGCGEDAETTSGIESTQRDIFATEDLRLAIEQTEALITGWAMDLAIGFKDAKSAIQGKPHPKFKTRKNGRSDHPGANSFLPLNFSLDLTKGQLAMSWSETHPLSKNRRTKGGKNTYETRVARGRTLEEGIEALENSLLKNHSDEDGASAVPNGLTRQQAEAFRELVYKTETGAYFLRRLWAPVQKMQKNFKAITHHRPLMDASGVFNNSKYPNTPIFVMSDSEDGERVDGQE